MNLTDLICNLLDPHAVGKGNFPVTLKVEGREFQAAVIKVAKDRVILEGYEEVI